MKYFQFLLMTMTIIMTTIAQPPNNAIFNGGINDGFHKATFLQAGNNIYTGGVGNGWAKNNFMQAGSNIFSGGNGDGWAKTMFLQPGNNIFNGGDGDGWAKTLFLLPGNDIFNGGNGDGWAKILFAQPGNNIYNGGAGDGWASTNLPMSPLPVRFIYFTAKKQGSTVAVLNWQTAEELNADFYQVERSTDAVSFFPIGSVKASGSNALHNYSFTDNAPQKGYNYYRLKQVDKDAAFIYTPARLVNFNELVPGNIKYYPNPTNGILHIEVPAIFPAQVFMITIANEAGIVVAQMRVSTATGNIIPINMNKYARGIYFVQLRSAVLSSTQRIILQ